MAKKRNLLLPIILLILLAAACGAAGKLYIDHRAAEKALAQAEAELDASRTMLAELEQSLAAVRSERDDCAAQLDALERKLSGVEDDALLLEGEREELVEQIRLMRLTLNEKEAAIAALELDIANYNTVYGSDVIARADAIEQILTALEEEAPLRRIAKVDEDGNPVEPPEGREVLKEDEEYYYVYPRLALYYEDIATGHRLTYGEEELFFSASLIKAPYVLWLLEEISREEDAARARAEALYAAEETTAEETTASPETTAVPETTSAPETTAPPETTSSPETSGTPDETMSSLDETTVGTPVEERPEMIFEDERYDLSRIFVYTEEDFREGSGIIQHSEEGTEYTYRELIELAIRKSDNVAFGELREVFGYSGFYSYNTRLGVNSVRQRFNDITAADMAKYLRAMYTFIEEDENYGATFKEWLCSSAHTVMIPYAVYPTQTAHKYGWDIDAYHDAAIVYDEHPYLLVVLTDLDEGGTEVDTYIRRVVKLIHSLHRQSYA